MSHYSALFYEMEEKSFMLSQKKFCVLFVDNMFLNQSANMIMQY